MSLPSDFPVDFSVVYFVSFFSLFIFVKFFRGVFTWLLVKRNVPGALFVRPRSAVRKASGSLRSATAPFACVIGRGFGVPFIE